MLTITSHSLTRQTETEISGPVPRLYRGDGADRALTARNGVLPQWSLDTALRERTRRLSRPGWAGPR